MYALCHILSHKDREMTLRVLAIIPARGGSKGLPRKNIIDFDGKPLIAWTIEASLNSKYITKTVVSSDDDEILNISKKYGSDTIKRPFDLASDNATSESVVKHAIDYLSSNGEEFDILILLQPTSPLRTAIDIDEGFGIMFHSEATAVISVCEYDSKILKSCKENEKGFLEGVTKNEYLFMKRQDLPIVYMPNGAFYIIYKSLFLDRITFMTDNTSPYVMPVNLSVDIDTIEDINNIEKD